MSDKDNHKKEAIELAEKIYNLDHDAYMASGSALGHVYTDDRDASIEQILQCMETPEVRELAGIRQAIISNDQNKNATYVDGQELQSGDAVILRDGSEIIMGKTHVIYKER